MYSIPRAMVPVWHRVLLASLAGAGLAYLPVTGQAHRGAARTAFPSQAGSADSLSVAQHGRIKGGHLRPKTAPARPEKTDRQMHSRLGRKVGKTQALNSNQILLGLFVVLSLVARAGYSVPGHAVAVAARNCSGLL
mmetsp:Transcript_39280/g.73293  ORF Transcript_39280/g.73293 Transcript_39280/m.73293 type:complete len:136 (-) Transcript_39280:72-479(-)